MTSGVKVRDTARQVGLGLLGVTAVTAICFPLHLDFAIAGFLYLLVVVLQSPAGGFVSSAIVALVAVLCLDYFFTPPLLKLEIASPIDAVALATCLLTSLIITRLASKAREKAYDAEHKQRALARLYETAWRMYSVEPQAASGRGTLQIFQEVLDVEAICLYDAGVGESEIVGSASPGLAERTRDVCLQRCNDEDQPARIDIRCLNVAGKLIGAIGFQGLSDAESLAGPLSMLAGATLERARSFQAASESAATSQAEILRSAIVDAFAHQFKTPLAAILAAAGGVREGRALTPQQLELIEIVEAETLRLSGLTTRLLATARLDRAEVQPRLEPTDLTELIARMADQCPEARPVSMVLDSAPIEVASDRELLTLALSQLLDNACKYSPLSSPVRINLESKNGEALVRVTNHGNGIAPGERERIFERFYRGSSASRESRGAGLGLYIARKIVRAHLGSLELEAHAPDGEATTFCLRLPILETRPQHALKAG